MGRTGSYAGVTLGNLAPVARVQPHLQKNSEFPNFLLAARPKSLLYPPPSCPTEGRLEIVTDAGQDAVDADALTDERRLMRTAKSCGPDAPTLASSCADDSRAATVAKEPGHRGEHEGNR